MAEGYRLLRKQKAQIRRYVNYHVAQGWNEVEMLQWIHDGFRSWPPYKAYALAYYAALQTAEPITLSKS